MGWGHVFFGFSGRANRAKYWLVTVVWMIIGIIFAVVTIAVMFRDIGTASEDQIVNLLIAKGLPFLLVFLLIGLVSFISSLAIGIKRLHDRNKNGAWILLFYFLPGVLQGVGQALDNDAVRIVLLVVSAAIYIWAFIELGCLRGTVGPNNYGPDPLEMNLV